MPLAFPRGVLVLLFTGMAYAADPVGVVAKVVGEWTYQRGVATAGEAIFPGDRFAPTGDGPHQIVAIRYDTGSTERRNCDSGTPCVPFSLNPGPADATTVPTGIGRMLDYFSGSRKLPPVYAQSRSLALPVPDSSLLPETAIPEAAPGTVDFGALIQRTPETPSDFTFLVQTPEGAELLRTRLTERNAMRLADVHPGVYVVRIVGHEAVATSIVAVFPAEAAARARQSLDLLKRDVDQWDAQSELDQVARQTLFLNALINLEARP